VATRSRWGRGHGFEGKGEVGRARKCDRQLLTALCGGSWTSGSRCWDVLKSTRKLKKSYVLCIHVNKCISCMIHRCFDSVGTLCDLLTARPNRYNNHAPTEPHNPPDLHAWFQLVAAVCQPGQRHLCSCQRTFLDSMPT